MKAVEVADYRELARRRLPPFLFEYIDGGSYAQTTLKRNIEDLRDVALRQQVMRDVSKIDLSTELFGQKMVMPVCLSPVGISGLFARRGEIQALRAASKAGVPMCLSTVSVCSIDELADAVDTPFWFQLYMVRDRGFMKDLLARAKARHSPVLVLTVDLPLPGARYRDYRSGLSGEGKWIGPMRRFAQTVMHPHWAYDVGLRGRPLSLGNLAPIVGASAPLSDFLTWIGKNFDPSITWKEIEWLRDQWSGPIVIKGILDVEDAATAAAMNVDGIIVSNHGGRQLDGVLSGAKALPPIAEKVGDRLTVLADGGVRSGLDVFRMLALGAKGVFLGRAWAYALAARGEAGVSHMLELMASEMRIAMSLTGCTAARDASSDFLVK